MNTKLERADMVMPGQTVNLAGYSYFVKGISYDKPIDTLGVRRALMLLVWNGKGDNPGQDNHQTTEAFLPWCLVERAHEAA